MISVRLKHYTRENIDEYMKADSVGVRIRDIATEAEGELGCQRWLVESAPKRMVFDDVYRDLLDGGPSRTVLDVGGGVTSFTKTLGQSHDYTLIDLLAHDDERIATGIFEVSPVTFIKKDWFVADVAAGYDLIVSNDLFPNVDQRLKLFFDKFLSRAKTLKIMLTYYNNDRFYEVKRTNGDEILFFQAWNGAQLSRLLGSYFPQLEADQLNGLLRKGPSLYPNGRLTSLLTIEQV